LTLAEVGSGRAPKPDDALQIIMLTYELHAARHMRPPPKITPQLAHRCPGQLFVYMRRENS